MVFEYGRGAGATPKRALATCFALALFALIPLWAQAGDPSGGVSTLEMGRPAGSPIPPTPPMLDGNSNTTDGKVQDTSTQIDKGERNTLPGTIPSGESLALLDAYKSMACTLQWTIGIVISLIVALFGAGLLGGFLGARGYDNFKRLLRDAEQELKELKQQEAEKLERLLDQARQEVAGLREMTEQHVTGLERRLRNEYTLVRRVDAVMEKLERDISAAQRDTKEAIEWAMDSIHAVRGKADARSAEELLVQGLEAQISERWDEARACFEKAVAMGNAEYLTYYNLVAVLIRTGQGAEAERWKQPAIESAAKGPDASNRLRALMQLLDQSNDNGETLCAGQSKEHT